MKNRESDTLSGQVKTDRIILCLFVCRTFHKSRHVFISTLGEVSLTFYEEMDTRKNLTVIFKTFYLKSNIMLKMYIFKIVITLYTCPILIQHSPISTSTEQNVFKHNLHKCICLHAVADLLQKNIFIHSYLFFACPVVLFPLGNNLPCFCKQSL